MDAGDVIGEAVRLALSWGLIGWWQALAVVLVVALVIVAKKSGAILGPHSPVLPTKQAEQPEAPPMEMPPGGMNVPGKKWEDGEP